MRRHQIKMETQTVIGQQNNQKKLNSKQSDVRHLCAFP